MGESASSVMWKVYERNLSLLAVTDTPEHEAMPRLSLFSKHVKSKIK